MLKKLYDFHYDKKAFYEKFPSIHMLISLGGILLWVFAFKSSVLDANHIPSGSMIPTLKIGDLLFVNKMRYSFHIPFTDIRLFNIDTPKRGDIVTFTPPKEILPNGELRERRELEGKTLVKRIVGIPHDKLTVKDNRIFIQDIPYPIVLITDSKERNVLNDLDYKHRKEDLDLFYEQVINPETKQLIVKHFVMMFKMDDFEYSAMTSSELRNPGHSFEIPEGKYLMMGDNRDDSSDSRVFGLVNAEDIHGKVFMSYFSVNWGDNLSYRSMFSDSNRGTWLDNPIFKFVRAIFSSDSAAYIRWNRVGKRIY